jgi:predicted ArsR family transcriptional regulator
MAECSISSAGLRVMRLLVGNPPQTIMDLIESAGVTRTAVTEQLNELVAVGLVERTTERLTGRGRPRHLFSATHAAMVLLFPSGQQQVVPAIWQAIDESGGPEMTKKIIKRVSRLLADCYAAKITAKEPKERLRRLVELLRAEGGLLDIKGQDGSLVVFKRSCPFISMLDDRRMVCSMDMEMMSAVVGRPMIRTACRHDGAPCCTLQIESERQ